MANESVAAQMKEQFDSQAAEYERMVGGTTRRIAEKCLPYLPPITSTSRFLDNGSGPGIVTRLILDTAAEQGINPLPHVTAVDIAPGMIAQVEANAEHSGWTTVDSHVLSAENLEGIQSDAYDGVVMNFALFALPDAVKGAREMLRVLKPQGVAVVTTWKKSAPVEVLEKAVAAIRPQDTANVFPISKDWLTMEKVRDTMVAGGFSKVSVKEERSVWKNSSQEELLSVLTGPFWQRIWANWSEEEKARLKPEIMKQIQNETGEKGVEMEIIAWICAGVKE
jgi:ubiquinone/menaquinone biosynthesis C-methylase UbiE